MANKIYKYKIGQEVKNELPTATDPTHGVNLGQVKLLATPDDYPDKAALLADQANQTVGVKYTMLNANGWDDPEQDAITHNGWATVKYLGTTNGNESDYDLREQQDFDSGSGITNVNRGTFAGEFNVSDGNNGYYDDVASGGDLGELSLSTSKAIGTTATVRILGNATFSIPAAWNFSGQTISTNSTILNELSIMYINDNDIRIVNRLFPYIPTTTFIDWRGEVETVDNGGGTLLNTASGLGGWERGAYGYREMTGDNAVSFSVTGRAALGLTATYRDIAVEEWTTPDVKILMIHETTNKFYVYEGANLVYESGAVLTSEANDVATLRLTGTTITAELNGTPLHTCALTYSNPLTPVGLHHENYPNSVISQAEWDSLTNLQISSI